MQPDVERSQHVREALASLRLDALICRLPENVVLLSGYYPIVGQSFVVFPQEGEPILIAPAQERYLAGEGSIADIRAFDCWRLGDLTAAKCQARLLRQLCAEKQLYGKAIGYEDSFEVIAPPQLAAEPPVLSPQTFGMLQDIFGSALRPATELLYQLRAIKSPMEIARLRRANEIACLGLQTFKEWAQPGRTEAEVAAAVEQTIYSRGVGYQGARYARGWAQVMSGPNTETAWFYPVSKDRRIQRGDLVVIELGTVVDGYWSDLTRTVVAGQASDLQRQVYQTVLEAQQADLIAERPGVRGDEVDAVGRKIVAERGFGQYFVHHTGHGIGFRYHEPYPSLHPDSRHVLAAGHVHSIEPGIYIPGFGGVRVEDDAVVLETGAEFLSKTSFGLD